MSAREITIVLARLVDDVEVTSPGQPDLGIRPKTKAVQRPEALVWLNRGTTADIAKASKFATTEGYEVFTYPTTERDPLGRAKRDVVRKSSCVEAKPR